jgi:hypothetical protein
MKQKIATVFEIEEKEVREALHDYFVKKLKGRNLNCVFSPNDIDIFSYGNGASIIINENKEIE